MDAMDFFSDPQATRSRFGDVIDDLHDVFRCHGVDFGSPDDFFAFSRTMKYHSELRSDVMRVVKFVMDSETNVSFRTILTILAVGSGGLEVATSGYEMKVPVSLIIESLVGAGDCSPLNVEQPESSSTQPIANEAVEAVALERSSSGGEEPAGGAAMERVLVEEPASMSSIGSTIDQNPFMGRSDSNALAESLSRIELNSVQLKIYLDSIEQRISRMEPRLENVPPVPVSGPPAPRDQEGAIFSAVVASATVPPAGGGELAYHDPPRIELAEYEEMATKSPAVPRQLWRDFAHSDVLKRRRALPILVGLAILLLAASIFWRVRRDSGYVVVRPVNALVQAPDAAGVSSRARPGVPGVGDPSTGTAGGSKAAIARDSSVAVVEKAQSVNSAPVDSDASHGGNPGQQGRRLADVDLPSPKKPARVAMRSSFSSSPAGDQETAATMTDTSADTDPPDRTTKLNSEPVSDRPVNVSSGVMAANLLSGPKPSYPALASLTHIRGDVVMLAVISKDGSVKDLHVIKGHRLLRGAAKNAVRNWRYRPYTINGVPVDVSTLVNVDFSLSQ